MEERQQGVGRCEGVLAERGRGEDAGWPLRSREAAGGRGGLGHRDRWARAGPAGRPRGPAAGIRRRGRLAPTQCPDRGVQPRTGRRDRGARAPRVPGGGRGPGGCRAGMGQRASVLAVRARAAAGPARVVRSRRGRGVGRGGWGRVGPGERARWEAQVCVGWQGAAAASPGLSGRPGGACWTCRPGTGE